MEWLWRLSEESVGSCGAWRKDTVWVVVREDRGQQGRNGDACLRTSMGSPLVVNTRALACS